MAGDWIKVEVGTASKTEVLRIAEMLGIDRRHCMGLLVDYWAWLDANTRTDLVPNLSRSSLDSVLHCAGFSACLEAVGWAKWDADGWQMTVVNYDHHNGSSAKTRASEQRKKREQRRQNRDTNGTQPGPEKRREEVKALTTMSSSPESAANIDVTPLVVNTANSERREQAREILAFLNAKTSRNYRMVDANLGPIMARLKEGATVRDMRAVIARKCREWGADERMTGYLRPATLFNATKFAQYVGEVPPAPEVSDGAALS